MKCIVCDRNSWFRVDKVTDVVRPIFAGSHVVRCRTCGLGRLEPFPSSAEVRAIYSDSAYATAYDDAGQSFVMADSEARSLLSSRFARLDEYLPDRRRILDIGASRGIFLNAARHARWETSGLEASADSIEFARTHYEIDIQHGTIETANLPDNSFDCVHASHVLEHLHDPLGSLQRIHQILRPEGIVVIEVPFEFGDLFDRFRQAVLRRPRVVNRVPSSHLYFFTLQSLTALLKRSRFCVMHASTPRRNQSYDSRIPMGAQIKRGLYWVEQLLHLGPLIEVYARKTESFAEPKQ